MPVNTNIVTIQIIPMFQAANNVALGCVIHIKTPDKYTQTAAKGYLKKSITYKTLYYHTHNLN